MESSILITIKNILGLASDYTVFDLNILTHINTAFSTLTQLGIGPKQGFAIEDDSATWDTFIQDDLQLNAVKTYIYLKVRLLFDPPTTSFLIEAAEKQLRECEWRLNVQRESNMVTDLPEGSFQEVL